MLARGEKQAMIRFLAVGIISTLSLILCTNLRAQTSDSFLFHKQFASAGHPNNYGVSYNKKDTSTDVSNQSDSSDPKKLFEEGYKQRLEGRYQDAVKNLQQAADLWPDNTDVLRELGIARLSLGDMDKAKQDFQGVLEHIPDDNEAKFYLSKIAYAHNNLSEASKLIDELLAKAPDNEEAKQLKQQLIAARREHDKQTGHEAAKAASLPLLLFSEQYTPLRVPDEKSNISQVKGSLTRQNFHNADHVKNTISIRYLANFSTKTHLLAFEKEDYLLQLASIELLHGNIQVAKHDILDAIHYNPTSSRGRLMLASVYYWEGDFKKAQSTVQKLILLAPNNVSAKNMALTLEKAVKFNQGELKEKTNNPASLVPSISKVQASKLYEQGYNERKLLHFKQAKNYLEEAMKLDPDNPDILVQLGLSLLPLGEIDEAKQNFTKALEIAPNYTEARAGLARIAYWQNDLATAKLFVEMALSQAPSDEELTKLASNIDKAIDAKAKTVIRHNKKPSKSLDYNRQIGQLTEKASRIVASGKDFPEAESLYQKAVKMAPNDTDLIVKLGNVQLFQRKFDQAEQTFDHVLVLCPNCIDAYIGKINSAIWQKDYFLARRRIFEALNHYPNDERLIYLNAQIYLFEHRYKEAIKSFNQQISTNPKNASLWIGLGDAERGLLQDHKAVLAYKTAQTIDPKGRDAANRLAAPIRKRWRLDADGSYSSLTKPYKDWRDGGIALSYRLSETNILTGRIGLAHRFGKDDQQIEMTLAHQFKELVWGYIGGAVTPDADILARYTVRAGGSIPVIKFDGIGMLGATLDAKSDWYDNGVVKTITPGLRQSFLDDDFVLYVQWINIFDQMNRHSGGYLLRADASPISSLHFNIGYSDTLESSGDEMIPTKAVFGGVGFDLNDETTIGLNLDRDHRENAYNRMVYDLSLTRHF